MSLFITFEGEEGSGKSYQSAELFTWLKNRDVPVILTHEPGGTMLGEKVSNLLKWGRETAISPLTELLLFNASRAQLVMNIIRPALHAGETVICDRFTDSTIAYQSYGRGISLKTVRSINTAATGGLLPDLTILLDISIEDGLSRKKGEKLDRFEQEDKKFHRKVREGYLKLASKEPERFLVINAVQSRETISKIIRDKINRMLSIET
jgi:dTMP kinase